MFTNQELNVLKGMLNKISQSSTKPKPRNRRRNKQPVNQVAAQSATNQPRRRRRGRRNQQALNTVDGSITVSRVEFLYKVQLDAKGNLDDKVSLAADSFSWLSNLSKAFDRIIWHQCVLEYRPYSSAMNSGNVAVGVDWNFSNSPSRSVTLACTPSFNAPVYTAKTVTLPTSQLMSRKAYILKATDQTDKSPGQLLISASSDKVSLYCGDIFVRYNVTLTGTSA